MLDDKEFEEAAKSSNIIMYRTYSADTKKKVLAYRKDLCEGKFYVESEGGHVFGRGSYFAIAPFDDSVASDEAEKESKLYKGDTYAITETATLCKDTKLYDFDAKNWKIRNYNEAKIKVEFIEKRFAMLRNNLDKYDCKKMKYLLRKSREVLNKWEAGIKTSSVNQTWVDYIRNLEDEFIAIDKSFGFDYTDIGSMVAAMGYDGIYVKQNYSADYLVLLNRTKLIVKRGKNSDVYD